MKGPASYRWAARRGPMAGALLLAQLGTVATGQAAEPIPLTEPPSGRPYLQYGGGFAGMSVVDPGAICINDKSAPCILGSGGGLVVRGGYRAPERWWLGGAYEFLRLDADNILPLPILQTARGEARYYLTAGQRTTPFLAGSLGGTLFGNEWTADTWGASGSVGAGLEWEISARALLQTSLQYRLVALRAWTDDAGEEHGDGALGMGWVHAIVVEFTFEPRDPLSRL